MKKLITAIALVLIANNAQAGVVKAHVNGLVCAFCATAIENSLKEKPGVKSTDVNLDSKVVTIDFSEGKEMSDKEITDTLTDAGYSVTKIER